MSYQHLSSRNSDVESLDGETQHLKKNSDKIAAVNTITFSPKLGSNSQEWLVSYLLYTLHR